MSKKSDNDFITRLECTTVSSAIKRDLSEIKVALIGQDMQGGIVKKLNDLDSKVGDIALAQNHVSHEKEVKEDRFSREKIALIGVVGAILGIIIDRALSLL